MDRWSTLVVYHHPIIYDISWSLSGLALGDGVMFDIG